MTIKACEHTRDRLDAIYASQRLRLPFDGVLLVGYCPRTTQRSTAPRTDWTIVRQRPYP